jgi:hypothetical protein
MVTIVWLGVIAVVSALMFSLRYVPDSLHPAEVWFVWLSASAVAQHHLNLLTTNWHWFGLPTGAKIFWSDELITVGLIPSLVVWLTSVWFHKEIGLIWKATVTFLWYAAVACGAPMLEWVGLATIKQGKLVNIYVQEAVYIAEMLLIAWIYRCFLVKARRAA